MRPLSCLCLFVITEVNSKSEVMARTSENCGNWGNKNTEEQSTLPFRVVSSDDRGRFLVATRDIEVNDTILDELPSVVVPITKCKAVCLGCLSSTNEDKNERCEQCHFPFCALCQSRSPSNLHSKEECAFLTQVFEDKKEERKETVVNLTNNKNVVCPFYACISPIRLLLLAHNQKEMWQKLDTLQDHINDRRECKKTWLLDHMLVMNVLRLSRSSSSLDISPMFIHRCLGIMRTNGVRVSDTAMALFPTFSLINHSCVVNTRTMKSDASQHFRLKFRNGESNCKELVATTRIGEGEQIYTRYTTPEQATIRRQQLLQRQWHFSCDCVRCMDPTEFGSNLNTLRCPGCAEPSLLPMNPRDIDSTWHCESCQLCVDHVAVITKITEIQTKIETVQRRLDVMEQLVEELQTHELHPNHYLILMLREKIVHLSRALLEKGLVKNPSEVVFMQKKQVEHFQVIRDLMVLVDPPGQLWQATLDALKNKCFSKKTK